MTAELLEAAEPAEDRDVAASTPGRERTPEEQRRRVAQYMWAAAGNCRRADRFTHTFRMETASTAGKGVGVLQDTHPELAARLAERAGKLHSSPHWGSVPRAGLAALFAEAARAADPDVAAEFQRVMRVRDERLSASLEDVLESIVRVVGHGLR